MTSPAAAMARLALITAFFGAGMNWLMPYLDRTLHLDLPEWVVIRFYLYSALPAALLGLRLWFTRTGGFARHASLAATAALLALSLAWTDSTELGRGLLKFSGFVITLPIAALVVAEKYTMRSAAAFLAGSVLSLVVAVLDAPTSSALRFGTLRDASGTWVSNPNSVGALAAFSAVLILIATFERRARRLPFAARLFGILSLPLCLYCTMATASRTAFLTLAGTVAWIIALRFRRTPGKLVPGALVAVCVVLSLSAFTAVAAEGALQSIYDQLGSRLVADNEGTVGTLGSRTLIWRFGLENLAATDRWAFGLGAGGVDKALGSFFELGLFAQGRDGIRRLHSHSTYIEWVLMLGFLGVLAPLALGIQTAWRSWRLDLAQGTVRRTALVVFAFLYSFGGVMNTEIFWIAFGSLLWAELTPGAPPLRPAAAAS